MWNRPTDTGHGSPSRQRFLERTVRPPIRFTNPPSLKTPREPSGFSRALFPSAHAYPVWRCAARLRGADGAGHDDSLAVLPGPLVMPFGIIAGNHCCGSELRRAASEMMPNGNMHSGQRVQGG